MLRWPAAGMQSTRHADQRACKRARHQESAGCLLPLFDLLNHRSGQRLTLTATPPGGAAAGSVTFTTDIGLDAGSELCNNYSNRSNEDLLFCYGFCLRDNPHDGASIRVGEEAFLVKRPDEGGVLDVLQALQAQDGDGDAAADDDGGDNDEMEELELDAEQFEAVSDALHDRLGALTRGEAADRELLAHSSRAQHKRKRDVAASAAAAQPLPVGSVAARRAEEASRRLSIAMYREGLREVLTDAIASLEEMTGA